MALDELIPAPPPASFFARTAAFLFDLLPAAAVAAAIAIGLTWRFDLAPDGGWPFAFPVAGWGLAAGVLFAFLYHVLWEGLGGATPGKMVLRCQVRRADYSRCGVGLALLRTLGWVPDLLGWLGILSSGRQRLGDHLAGTVVVEQSASPGRARNWSLAVVGLTGAVALGCYLAARYESRNLRVIQPFMVSLSEPGNLRTLRFRPGERVGLSFEIAGFLDETPEGAALEVDVTPWAANNLRIAKPWRKKLTARRRSEQHLRIEAAVLLPDLLPLGPARFEVKVRDTLQDKFVVRTLPFQLEEPDVDATGGLRVQDFQASDLPEGPYPAVPQVRRGHGIYFRMKVYGVTFRGDSAGLETDGRLFDSAGTLIVERRSFLRQQGSFPGRPGNFYFPLSGRVQLAPAFKAGSYRLHLTVRDQSASTEATVDVPFQVVQD